jgi:Mce-associated membrane protein
MEGDAGEVSRLNPTDADGEPQDGAPTSDEVDTEAAAEKPASDAAAEEPASNAAAEKPTSDAAAEEPTSDAAAEEPTSDAAAEEPASAAPTDDAARPSLIGRGWLIAVCVALLVLSAGVATGGYLALRAHGVSQADVRAETVAMRAARDCVAATQAPDTAAAAASQAKMIECSTGDFNVQATVYSSMLVEAYQAAKVQVKVSDMRAAVERHNDDGSIQVLVAFRVKVTNSEAADQEQGYRLRVKMASSDGTYKMARVDQVTS